MTRLLAVALVTGLLSACSAQSFSPVAPNSVGFSSVAPWLALAGGGPDTLGSHTDTHGHALTAVSGSGVGVVNVSPTAEPVDGANPGFGFSVQGVVTLHGAPRNTTFLVQRKPDFTVNGQCTGPTFITFPAPNPGPPVTLTTSAGGAGAAHFELHLPLLENGSQFDVMFQLLEASPNPGATVLRSECFTVTVK